VYIFMGTEFEEAVVAYFKTLFGRSPVQTEKNTYNCLRKD